MKGCEFWIWFLPIHPCIHYIRRDRRIKIVFLACISDLTLCSIARTELDWVVSRQYDTNANRCQGLSRFVRPSIYGSFVQCIDWCLLVQSPIKNNKQVCFQCLAASAVVNRSDWQQVPCRWCLLLLRTCDIFSRRHGRPVTHNEWHLHIIVSSVLLNFRHERKISATVMLTSLNGYFCERLVSHKILISACGRVTLFFHVSSSSSIRFFFSSIPIYTIIVMLSCPDDLSSSCHFWYIHYHYNHIARPSIHSAIYHHHVFVSSMLGDICTPIILSCKHTCCQSCLGSWFSTGQTITMSIGNLLEWDFFTLVF